MNNDNLYIVVTWIKIVICILLYYLTNDYSLTKIEVSILDKQ